MRKTFLILCVIMMLCALTVPAYAVSDAAVTVPAADAVLELFPALFDGIVALFECPPMLYLFSIFILAFVVLIFRTITGL